MRFDFSIGSLLRKLIVQPWITFELCFPGLSVLAHDDFGNMQWLALTLSSVFQTRDRSYNHRPCRQCELRKSGQALAGKRSKCGTTSNKNMGTHVKVG